MIELDQFTQEVNQSIPLTQAMGLKYQSFDPMSCDLITSMPFAPNINDKSTVFGGSMAALATFSGWSLATLICRQASLDCDIVVFKSEMEYLLPISDDCYSHAMVGSSVRERFITGLNSRGKARISIELSIKQGETTAATYRGDYAARIK